MLETLCLGGTIIVVQLAMLSPFRKSTVLQRSTWRLQHRQAYILSHIS